MVETCTDDDPLGRAVFDSHHPSAVTLHHALALFVVSRVKKSVHAQAYMCAGIVGAIQQQLNECKVASVSLKETRGRRTKTRCGGGKGPIITVAPVVVVIDVAGQTDVYCRLGVEKGSLVLIILCKCLDPGCIFDCVM